jgi:ElaB/YqjD/DUF883 family membrane-anchored ribosome-binding protein
MPTNSQTYNDPFPGDSPSVGEKIADTAAQVRDKISDLGQTAAEKIDENRDAAASGLQKAASALRGSAENLPGGERVAGFAQATAEKLSTTADYVRDHDLNRMMADVETLVKNNPGPSLIAAAVIGFLVGRTFTRND